MATRSANDGSDLIASSISRRLLCSSGMAILLGKSSATCRGCAAPAVGGMRSSATSAGCATRAPDFHCFREPQRDMKTPRKSNHEDTKNTKKEKNESSCSSYLRGCFSSFQARVHHIRE